MYEPLNMNNSDFNQNVNYISHLNSSYESNNSFTDFMIDIDKDIGFIKRYLNSKYVQHLSNKLDKNNKNIDLNPLIESFNKKSLQDQPIKCYKDMIVIDEVDDNSSKKKYLTSDEIKTNNMSDYLDIITKMAYKKNWRSLDEIHKKKKLKEYVESLEIKEMKRKKELFQILLEMIEKKTLKNKSVDYCIEETIIKSIDVFEIVDQDFILKDNLK